MPGKLAILAQVICCSGNCRITLSPIGYASQLPHRGVTSLLSALTNQLKTYELTQVGCLVQTHHAIDLLVLRGERSRIK